ncbi:MAG: hypothetical protein ABL917_03850 [Parcubacteria group bacterium]
MKNIYTARLFETENINISATDGTDTLAESGVFKGGVYLTPLPKSAGKPSLQSTAEVHEMIGDAKFTELFGSFGENRKRWQESQVVQFCRDHWSKIRPGNYVTFFELDNGFVVGVLIDDDNKLRAFIRSFSYANVWHAEYRRRIVVLS